MLFKKELAEKILTGEKTQTRRPLKAGEVLRVKESPFGGVDPVAVIQNGRTKIRVGGDYAVQTKRGGYGRLMTSETHQWIGDDRVNQYWRVKKGVEEGVFAPPDYPDVYVPMRIRVTDIRRVDVREINHADALAEGFRHRQYFWDVWCQFYDATMAKEIWLYDPTEAYKTLKMRPAELYQAWAYTFELV